MQREIDSIIIHCADTYPEMDIGAEDIRQWHIARGWSDIGYHYVVRRNGEVEEGRPLDVAGAHARGYNETSVGICLVGGKARPGLQPCNFTIEQWQSLAELIVDLEGRFEIDSVLGHNAVSDKACPTFDVRAWWGSK